MKHLYKSGIALAAITAVISGFSIFYNKVAVVSGLDATIFNFVKNGAVGLLFTALLFQKRKFLTLTGLPARKKMHLGLIAVVGGSVPFVLFFEGLKQIPAINATLIHKSMFLWITLLALPLLGEKIKQTHLVAYILIAAANLFIGGFSGFTGSKGELLIVTATVLWSCEVILSKKLLSSVDSIIVSWGRMFGGALVLLGVALFQGKLPLLLSISASQLLPIFGSILFLFGYVFFWHKSLAKAKASVVTAVLILSTPITNALSAIFITHALPPAQIINLAGTLVGIGVLLFAERKTRKPASPALSQIPLQADS